MIEEVVAPLLHNRLPVTVADNTELPQLFVTVTTGIAGVTGCALICALPDAGEVHPSSLVTLNT